MAKKFQFVIGAPKKEEEEVQTVHLGLRPRDGGEGVDLVELDKDGDVDSFVLNISPEGKLRRFAYGYISNDACEGDDDVIALDPDVFHD